MSQTMTDQLTPAEEQTLRKTLMRANEQGLGIAIGLLTGVGLFLATIVLVIKGGNRVGPHLGLVGVYFPGYTVTWIGSFVGFVYAFVAGYAIGRTVATIYNRIILPMS
jgi:hypothetical protein